LTDFARCIEHSLLSPTTTSADIQKLCAEAVEYGFYSVCVNPCHVRLASGLLSGTGARVTTVIGFPLGATLTEVKVYEAMQAALSGADELDMVMNVGAALSGDWEAVRKDISDVVAATTGLVHKVIIECCYLTDEQKQTAARTAVEAGAGYVKTSTGFGPSGATPEDVRLIRAAVGDSAGVKAAGGIRTAAQAMAMVEAGADLIGTSNGPAIISPED